MTGKRLLMSSCAVALLAATGCLEANILPFDGGEAGRGGSAGGSAGRGGSAGGGASGSGVAGEGGVGGISGSGPGGSGASGGSGGSGGSAGAAGRGGSGGTVGGSGGRGGDGGSTGGTGGAAGRGGAGGGPVAGMGGGGSGGGPVAGMGGGGTGGIGGVGGVSGTGGGVVAVTPTVHGQIVITELMHDASGIDDNLGEWFEVYNPSPTVTYELMGCEARDTSPGMIIGTSLLLPPLTFKTLAVSASPGFLPDYVYTPSGATPVVKFDNSGADEARIVCGGVLIDVFGYSQLMASMGAGHTFSVDPDHYSAADNDSPANWCVARDSVAGDAYELSGPNYGTPGRANTTQCP